MAIRSLGQFEKNVGVSFSYVKKDLLSVNDSVSDLHDKIQHLSLNQAMLLEKFVKLEQKLSGKKVAVPAKAKKASGRSYKKKASKKIVKKETITYQ